MKFDPDSARPLFASKDQDELIRIAFLEDTFLDEAKNLAKQELARRGLSGMSSEMIERVRVDFEAQKVAKVERDLQGLEIEEGIPIWRKAVRARIAPYRQPITFAALMMMALFLLNSLCHWEFMSLNERQSNGVGVFVGLLWLFFVAPTRKEFLSMRKPHN
jgi:hypothetical protein